MDARPTSPAPEAPPDAYDVFISYGGPDKAVAQRFRQALINAGLRPWAAFEDIPLGAKYSERIVAAIQRCRAVAVLVSPGSMASEHVFREVAEAASTRKPILPLYIAPDVVLPEGVLYYLAPLHRVRVAPDEIERAAPLVAAALRDPQTWQRNATPPPLLDRLRASPVRSASLALGIAVLAGLIVWGLQALWQQRGDAQALAQADALPATLGLVQVQAAERSVQASAPANAAPWRLHLSVMLASEATRYGDTRLLVHSRGDTGAAGEVFDLTPVLNATQVGGGQMLAADMPGLGPQLTACLTLPHPRSGEAWRLTTAFGGERATGADGVERLTYRPTAAPRAAREDSSPCE